MRKLKQVARKMAMTFETGMLIATT
jgi:hypothetical protein